MLGWIQVQVQIKAKIFVARAENTGEAGRIALGMTKTYISHIARLNP